MNPWKEGDEIELRLRGKVSFVMRERVSVDWSGPMDSTTTHTLRDPMGAAKAKLPETSFVGTSIETSDCATVRVDLKPRPIVRRFVMTSSRGWDLGDLVVDFDPNGENPSLRYIESGEDEGILPLNETEQFELELRETVAAVCARLGISEDAWKRALG